MIHPKELRQGNLVYTINRREKVHIPETVALRIITLGLFEAEILLPRLNPANQSALPSSAYFDLSPIALSDGWLTKLGFEKSGVYWHRDKVYIYEWGIINVSYHTESIMNEGDDRYVIREIASVHDIQNYYFALTGKELEINI